MANTPDVKLVRTVRGTFKVRADDLDAYLERTGGEVVGGMENKTQTKTTTSKKSKSTSKAADKSEDKDES